MIRADRASLRYIDHGREAYACEAISIDVPQGEFLGILGPSGSGKSSLLYLLSGLKTPTTGEVFYNEANLAMLDDEARAKLRLREFGFVFQYPFLLGYLTALENVMIARPDRQARSSELAYEAMELLRTLGIEEKAHRMPHELSGGEKQRVCISRALLGGPSVIFADEPTASLDHKNGRAVVDLLNKHRNRGALVMVTHDPSMLGAADRVVSLNDGRLSNGI